MRANSNIFGSDGQGRNIRNVRPTVKYGGGSVGSRGKAREMIAYDKSFPSLIIPKKSPLYVLWVTELRFRN